MAGLRKSSGIILAAGLIGFGFLSPAFSQAADPLVGYWQTTDGTGVLQVTRCGQTICARLVWLRGDASVRDERNPNVAKRGQRVCGLNVFGGFRFQQNGNWANGSVYDPETGETISNVALRANRDELVLTVGRGLFAGSETWRRVSVPTQPCARASNSTASQ
jgi:uncharacterized protein (DUF2147 family)